MINVGEFLNNIAAKAGIDKNSAEFISLISNAELTKITVPDAVVTGIDSKLLSLDAARNNSELRAHFAAQTYSGIDNALKESLLANGLTDDDLKGFLEDKQTSKNIKTSIAKIAELEKSKAKATSGDKVELQKSIDSLNAKIASQIAEHNKQLESMKNNFENELIDANLSSMLSSYSYALPTDVSVSVLTAKNILSRELADKKAKIVRENGNLVLKTLDGAIYHDPTNHTPKSLKDFSDAVLTNNKLLKVSTKPDKPENPTFSGGQNTGNTGRILSSLDDSLSAFAD